MNTNNYFKAELDKFLGQIIKEGAVPPPLPEDITALSPWDEVEGEEDKPIGNMTQKELADFINNLDGRTFEELKSALDKVELPEADDIQYLNEKYRPTVETFAPNAREIRPTVTTLNSETDLDEAKFLASPEFESAYQSWIKQQHNESLGDKDITLSSRK